MWLTESTLIWSLVRQWWGMYGICFELLNVHWSFLQATREIPQLTECISKPLMECVVFMSLLCFCYATKSTPYPTQLKLTKACQSKPKFETHLQLQKFKPQNIKWKTQTLWHFCFSWRRILQCGLKNVSAQDETPKSMLEIRASFFEIFREYPNIGHGIFNLN
jgi:hypothetical protein